MEEIHSGKLAGMEELERRIAEERARVEAEYRIVLQNSVRFEKSIRNRWREKVREKNARIAALEARIAELELELNNRRGSVDRDVRERKLLALMLNDMGLSDIEEPDMVRTNEEVGALSDEELDRTLASRLGLDYPPDAEEFERALQGVEEPERASSEGPGGFTGAPDMSHEPRPEEREG